MLVILTHPNGWAIREQGFLRQAIKNVRADYTGSCRVTFVSEAEASVHFCMFHSNMESTQLVSNIDLGISGLPTFVLLAR